MGKGKINTNVFGDFNTNVQVLYKMWVFSYGSELCYSGK